MKNYIIISGSPRKGGNSDAIAERMANAMKSHGENVQIFRIADRKVTPCIACNSCKKTGKCVHKDDAAALIEDLTQCDGAVLADPIYFGDIPGTSKVLVDRLYCLFNPAKGPTEAVPGKKLGIAFTFGGSPVEAVAPVAEKIAQCWSITGFAEHKAVLFGGNNEKDAFVQNETQQKAVDELTAWLLG